MRVLPGFEPSAISSVDGESVTKFRALQVAPGSITDECERRIFTRWIMLNMQSWLSSHLVHGCIGPSRALSIVDDGRVSGKQICSAVQQGQRRQLLKVDAARLEMRLIEDVRAQAARLQSRAANMQHPAQFQHPGGLLVKLSTARQLALSHCKLTLRCAH